MIRQERLALADRLGSVTDAQWRQPSLCEGWTIHTVLAHLTVPFLVDRKEVVSTVVRERSITRAFDRQAQRIAATKTPEELVDVLRDNAATSFRPPGMPYEAPFTDILAHHADISWALGDNHEYWDDPARLRPSLDFLVSPRARIGFVTAGRAKGITLVATDLDWRHGGGAEVGGPGLSLIMALLGRAPAIDDLLGNGVPVLAR